MSDTEPGDTQVYTLTRRDVLRIRELLRTATEALLDARHGLLSLEADFAPLTGAYEQTSASTEDGELLLDELF